MFWTAEQIEQCPHVNFQAKLLCDMEVNFLFVASHSGSSVPCQEIGKYFKSLNLQNPQNSESQL